MPVTAAIQVMGVAKKVGNIQQLFGGVVEALKKLACKLEGSCHPKLLAGVNKVGFAGYTYRMSNGDTAYYWLTGERVTDWNDFDLWFVATGYDQKLKEAGVSQCCLKHFPQEAMQDRGYQKAADKYVEYGGHRILFDGTVSDKTAVELIKQQMRESGEAVSDVPILASIFPAANVSSVLWIGGILAAFAIAYYVYNHK